MKLFLVAFVAAHSSCAFAHGPTEGALSSQNTTKPISFKASTITPVGCRKNATDVDWPTPAEWKAALPNVSARPTSLAALVVRPDYHFNAMKVADVQAAVKFCAQHNIRLTIINSGHDFLGRNNAPSGLSLDVSRLGGVKVLEDFTPSLTGAESPVKSVNTIIPAVNKQAAVTFGVGISTQRLNNALHASKLFTMGAAHGTVTVAGGWGQMAGHGPLTSQYGLGVDQFLEFKVVIADGSLKIANKVSNTDLFWALRGGGGSTFGVVVEATVKAYRDVPITITSFTINSTLASGDGLWDAYSYFHRQFPEVVNGGVAGYYYLYPKYLRANMIHPGNVSGAENAKRFWKTHFEKMASFKNMSLASAKYIEYQTFKEYYDGRFGAIDNGCPSTMGKVPMKKRHGPGEGTVEAVPQGMTPLDSRLLGAAHFAHPNFTAALKAASPSILGISLGGGLQGHLVGGGAASIPNNETSVLPAWRQAYTHLVGMKLPGVGNVDSLRKLAPLPISGAYANEAHWTEENWKQTFWGDNYSRLSEIKSKYDPNMVFWASPGINADLMEVRGGRVCRVTGAVNFNIAPAIDNPYIPIAVSNTEDAGLINMDGADKDGENKGSKCRLPS